MPIKAGWWDSSLTLWDFSRSNKHCIQLSTTNTIYISRFVTTISAFRSSRPVLLTVKKVFLKRVSCEFLTNFKEEFFCKTPTVVLLTFAPIEIFYSNTVCNKSPAEAWICLVSFHGAAKTSFSHTFSSEQLLSSLKYNVTLYFQYFCHWIKI